jgi:hypothetical protein
MRTDKGKPSGANKSEGTGAPSGFKPEKINEDKKITDRYTDDDKQIKENVPTTHVNRNTDKLHPTNAGGYKNR